MTPEEAELRQESRRGAGATPLLVSSAIVLLGLAAGVLFWWPLLSYSWHYWAG